MLTRPDNGPRGERIPCMPFTEGSEGTEGPTGDKGREDPAFYVAASLTDYRLQYLQLVQ